MPQTRLEVQQTQKLSQSMQTAVHLLSMDLDGLAEYMRKALGENPALEYVPPQRSAHDYAVMVKTRYYGGRSAYSTPDVAAPVNTVEELEQQLRLARLSPEVRRAAVHLLHTLSPRGYMTQELEAFAVEAQVSAEVAQRALEAVQALEPTGIGARTLEECLGLQLRERPDADPLCGELVRLYLADIARGSLRQIAKETGATMARVQACVEVIRSLNPIPCSLDTGDVQYIMPEFSVEADADGQLSILFHNDFYPTIRQDESFRRLTDTLEGDELAFARRVQTSATQLIRAVEMRQATMEKVARIITREQRAFFLGQYSLVPLRVEDTAREIGVHETTVYRALQGKYLYCAQGTFPLGHFFQKEVAGGVSAARAREMILDICRESGRLSDRAIAEELERRGVRLSRRTVAKYRAEMNIHSSFLRAAEDKEE